MPETVEICAVGYADSVMLMQIAEQARSIEGVSDCMVAMATGLNLSLLTELGFGAASVEGVSASDMIVAVRGADDKSIQSARALIDSRLADSRSARGASPEHRRSHRTMRGAVRASQANLAVISLPGAQAAAEAADAIRAGSNVMIFSDGVPVAHERQLKELADERGLVVMGPDCGTALLAGVGLGFVNEVGPGGVGVVAASGTGAQHLMCLLDASGVGISHVIGVGGGDLSDEIGGLSTARALRALDADPATTHIAVVSKPPGPHTRRRISELIAELRTPVTLGLLGSGEPTITDLAAEVAAAAGCAGVELFRHMSGRAWRPGPLAGLFSGGTLATEAVEVLAGQGRRIASLKAFGGAATPEAIASCETDFIVDLGDDRFTSGRPHPMIDPSIRRSVIDELGRRPCSRHLLIDIVLGHSAHPDPAGAVVESVEGFLGAHPDGSVVAVVVGSNRDPQDLRRQRRILIEAGCDVFDSNARAAAEVARRLSGQRDLFCETSDAPPRTRPMNTDDPSRRACDAGTVSRPLIEILGGDLRVACAGLDLFEDSLRQQGLRPEPARWRQPADGPHMAATTEIALSEHFDRANQSAVERLVACRPRLIGIEPAARTVGLEKGEFLHAGPPIDWADASGPLRGALVGAAVFEGLADTVDAAAARFEAGDFTIEPCHGRRTVGPMAGVVSPGMPMLVFADDTGNRRAFCTLNEGLGKVLRFGAYSHEVIARLQWMRDVLAPTLDAVLQRLETVEIWALVSEALQMGDECHNRNRAATSLFLRAVGAELIELDAPADRIAECYRFIAGNDHFFLNATMGAAKLAADCARDVEGSTVVVAMARNGTDFGIQLAGTGDDWFTGPSAVPEGLLFAGFTPQDANPDIGDSTITETVGLGAFAMAAAPAIVGFVGGTADSALDSTLSMYDITVAEHPGFRVAALDNRGTPVGIDAARICRTGILPVVNTGIAGKVAGTGQIGAGLVEPPLSCFAAALSALTARTSRPL